MKRSQNMASIDEYYINSSNRLEWRWSSQWFDRNCCTVTNCHTILCVCVRVHVKWSLSIYWVADNPCFCCSRSVFWAEIFQEETQRERWHTLMSERNILLVPSSRNQVDCVLLLHPLFLRWIRSCCYCCRQFPARRCLLVRIFLSNDFTFILTRTTTFSPRMNNDFGRIQFIVCILTTLMHELAHSSPRSTKFACK